MLSECDGAEDVGGQALLGVLLLESLLPESWGPRVDGVELSSGRLPKLCYGLLAC